MGNGPRWFVTTYSGDDGIGDFAPAGLSLSRDSDLGFAISAANGGPRYDVCSAYMHAERVVGPPEKLLEIPGAFLYRCRVCHTFWIDAMGKVAQPVRYEEALRVFPELSNLDPGSDGS